MRVLITGSEGVLGSTLKKELRRRGHKVFGCDLVHSADQQVVRADICEHRQIARVFDDVQPEIVYHLAAEFGRKNGQDFYEQLWKANCIGTRNVIEECLHEFQGTKPTLIFASSSEAYGMSEFYAHDQPLQEEMLDHFVPKFHNEYALSKYTNERQIHLAARNNGLNAIILRFFNVYGPPERYTPYRSVVCQLIHKMLVGDPITVNKGGYRSHLWIGDWCSTVAGILDRLHFLKPVKDGQYEHTPTFNIGSDKYESILELYDRLRKLIVPCYSKVEFIESEIGNSATKRPDNFSAKAWFDHNPKMDLDEGLALTVAAMKEDYGF
jgi:dTDP-glucose 4,6-dehydratase